jgi:hypothetical protein
VGEFVSGMDCEFGHPSSWLEKIGVNVKSCSDNQYCCHEDDRVYCCSSSEFVSNRQVRTLHTQSFHLNL